MRKSTLSRRRARHISKLARLEARISTAQKMLFEHAARIQGKTLTEFVVVSAQEAAKSVVEEHELITLSAHDRQVFVKALLNPPVPSKRLRAAVKRYKTKVS